MNVSIFVHLLCATAVACYVFAVNYAQEIGALAAKIDSINLCQSMSLSDWRWLLWVRSEGSETAVLDPGPLDFQYDGNIITFRIFRTIWKRICHENSRESLGQISTVTHNSPVENSNYWHRWEIMVQFSRIIFSVIKAGLARCEWLERFCLVIAWGRIKL